MAHNKTFLQSKYSARSANYSRMTFINRERIVLFVSNFQVQLEYLNHPTVETIPRITAL